MLTHLKLYILLFRVDGGVSRNDYICQTIANVTSITVVRMKNSNRTEVSCLGAAFMAGLSSGMYLNIFQCYYCLKILYLYLNVHIRCMDK